MVKLVRILRLVKLLKLVRLFKNSGLLRKVQAVLGPGLLRLCYLSLVAVTIIHWMACAFYYAAYLQVSRQGAAQGGSAGAVQRCCRQGRQPCCQAASCAACCHAQIYSEPDEGSAAACRARMRARGWPWRAWPTPTSE
jgi:hypothetical protein